MWGWKGNGWGMGHLRISGGSIPGELGQLSALQTLYLYQNQLSGGQGFPPMNSLQLKGFHLLIPIPVFLW